MAFKRISTNNNNFNSPQELFTDIKNKTVNGLLDHQSQMINEYMEKYFSKKDIAMELPTGSGKTLVGLLIGEFRRIKKNEKVLYLCQNKQLVNQVVTQSKNKYGIKTTGYIGKTDEFTPTQKTNYITNKTISVTTYRSFFNNKTFFENPDLIIFDDAHSAESFIASFWSININKKDNKNLFFNTINLLKDSMEELSYEKMVDENPSNIDLEWNDKIPTAKVIDKFTILSSLITREIDWKQQQNWANIRDYLHACNIYIDCNNILIRPIIPPTKTFKFFDEAKQRIYMSATLGESGELERIIGIEKIERISLPDGWDKQGIGRRLFMFPSLSLKKQDINKLLKEFLIKSNRSLILTTSKTSLKKIKELIESFELNKDIYTNKDFEISKDNFTKNNGIAILANRFDGIDFENNECRLEILVDLPTAANLQEKFISKRLAASVLFNERIRTRIIQAIGRCTRGNSDYSIVCILGDEIIKQLYDDKKLKLLHPELQGELIFGVENSEGMKLNEFLENYDIFIEHSDEWDNIDKDIIKLRNDSLKEENPSFIKLKESAIYEVKYQYYIWKKDYLKALECVEHIINILNSNDLIGYRGFWNYIAGTICILATNDGDKTLQYKSKDFFKNALICSKGITWIKGLSLINQYSENPIDNETLKLDYLIENIEINMKNITASKRKLTSETSEVLNLLNDRGENFEQGLKKLGDLLGVDSKKNNTNGAPDTYWIFGETCIVSECKIYDDNKKSIPLKDVREALTHENWIKQNEKSTLNEIYTVFVSNTENLAHDAAIHANKLYYINKTDIINFATKYIRIFNDIHSSFSEEGVLEWRDLVSKELISKNITPIEIINKIQRKKLSKLNIT
ncbi:hypothetical protein CYK89_12170 [Clostridium perfringens]|uniref:DEAD/DEAH box helicase n=1 Tax=Clostridium perfringens TaxID=1502 RepID=UPI000D718BE7|nr:DEAD/DEAH box helicase [Clostridium perfringens]PWX37374.1 hypothetical protein CYK90_14665 [Clostridium perfringens]PWX53012.1 hypothetical protein CYK89_12170 [Clostridium perfringens]